MHNAQKLPVSAIIMISMNPDLRSGTVNKKYCYLQTELASG